MCVAAPSLSLYLTPVLQQLLAVFHALVIGPLLPLLLSALNVGCRRAMIE